MKLVKQSSLLRKFNYEVAIGHYQLKYDLFGMHCMSLMNPDPQI